VKVPSGNHAKCLPGQEGVRGSYATAPRRRRCTTRGGDVCRAARCHPQGGGYTVPALPPGAFVKEGGAPMPPCCGAFVVMKVEVVVKEEGSDWRLKG